MARQLSFRSVTQPFSDVEDSRVVKRESFKKIAGRYQLGKQIGEGAMSTVHNALDLQTNEIVAVKQMKEKTRGRHGNREKQVKAAITEVAALMRLEHKGIVALMDEVFENGEPYIVLEKLGENLRDGISKSEVTDQLRSIRTCLEISSQLCSAVAHMHSQGVIHRDIKPGNISLTREGPKLFDFGLAKTPGGFDPCEENPEMVVGTIAYMSPEQAGSGKPVGTYSDIYSLGATIYWMLSLGQLIFDADSDVVFLYCHKNQAPNPLRTRNPYVPGAVAAIVEKALEKDPADRFPSAESMKKAIDRLL